ncbi:MAG: hypothetical protein ACLTDS_12765, partial [Bianqueaceae bacterium]
MRSNESYKLPATGLTREFTISPAGLTIQWTNTKLIYNGSAQKPTATPIGAVNGETVTVSVSGEETDANKSGETYTARASIADKNYVIKSGETTEFEIIYLSVAEGAYTLSGIEGDNGWYISDVTVNPSDGYTIAENMSGPYGSNLMLPESTGQDYMIYLKNEKGQMTGGIAVGEIKIDKEDPGITVFGNTTDYLQSDTAIITAEDSTSGVAKVEVQKDTGEFVDITDSYKDGYAVVANGKYTFRVTDNAGRTAEKSLVYSGVDTVMPVVAITATTDGGDVYTDGSWTNQNVTLTLQNIAGNLGTTKFQYKVDGGQWMEYAVPILVSADTGAEGITYTFHATSASGVESEEKSITVKRDTVVPDGDIVVKENSIKQFLNNITFGLLFNETVDVTITGIDDLSGVKSIQYYRTNEILTEEQVKVLTDWKDYKKSVSETAADAEQFIYYVKVADHAGNMICFASNGVTFDLTKPLIDGIVDGGTYYTTQKPVVTDVNLDSTTLNGQPVVGEFILTGNMDMIYTIVAVDLAGNETVVTVMMKPIASLADPLDGLIVDNVSSNDKEVIEEVLDKVNAVETENATDQEKDALQKIRDDCTVLLDKINDTDEKIADVIEGVNSYDEDMVNSADKADIEQLMEDAETLLRSIMTENEKAILIDIIEAGHNLLDRIDEAAQAVNRDAVQSSDQVIQDTVTLEDKERLTEALEDLKSALENFGGNYTEIEAAEIQEDIERIQDALQTIQNVENAAEKIEALPNPDFIAISDEAAISDAQKAYDRLTEHEKSLVGAEWKDTLDKARKALEQAK